MRRPDDHCLDTQWEFKLRDDVRFHNGSAFTSDAVVYTIERIRDFLKPPSGGFRSYVSAIKSSRHRIPSPSSSRPMAPFPTYPLFLLHVRDEPALRGFPDEGRLERRS
ncbi:ABC transporter substrate-binding protein [Ensifer sp. Root31]|uniref:ABC transporter substrate-binding protein n=1 Tax=Ensifer sp. Root31 TaxID=1736512 RepID=UPI00244EC4D9|nr:ABC transporter substrate-binding protein [Ensifer sp. Root31]